MARSSELEFLRLTFRKLVSDGYPSSKGEKDDPSIECPISLATIGYFSSLEIRRRPELAFFNGEGENLKPLHEHLEARRWLVGKALGAKEQRKDEFKNTFDRRVLQGVGRKDSIGQVLDGLDKEHSEMGESHPFLAVTQFRFPQEVKGRALQSVISALDCSELAEGPLSLLLPEERQRIFTAAIVGFDAADLIFLVRSSRIKDCFRYVDALREMRMFPSEEQWCCEHSVTTFCYRSALTDEKRGEAFQEHVLVGDDVSCVKMQMRVKEVNRARPGSIDWVKLREGLGRAEVDVSSTLGHHDFIISARLEQWPEVFRQLNKLNNKLGATMEEGGAFFTVSTVFSLEEGDPILKNIGGEALLPEEDGKGVPALIEKYRKMLVGDWNGEPAVKEDLFEMLNAACEALINDETLAVSKRHLRAAFSRLNGSLLREISILFSELNQYPDRGFLPGSLSLRFAATLLIKHFVRLLRSVAVFLKRAGDTEADFVEAPIELFDQEKLLGDVISMRREVEKRSAASLHSHGRFTRGGYTAHVKIVGVDEMVSQLYLSRLRAHWCMREVYFCNFIVVENVGSSEFDYTPYSADVTSASLGEEDGEESIFTVTRIKRRMVENVPVGLYQTLHEAIQVTVRYLLSRPSFTSRVFNDTGVDYLVAECLEATEALVGPIGSSEGIFHHVRMFLVKYIDLDASSGRSAGELVQLGLHGKSDEEKRLFLKDLLGEAIADEFWEDSNFQIGEVEKKITEWYKKPPLPTSSSMSGELLDEPASDIYSALTLVYDSRSHDRFQDFLPYHHGVLRQASSRAAQFLCPFGSNVGLRQFDPFIEDMMLDSGRQKKGDSLMEIATLVNIARPLLAFASGEHAMEDEHANSTVRLMAKLFFDYHILAENREQPEEVQRNLWIWRVAATGVILVPHLDGGDRKTAMPLRMPLSQDWKEMIGKAYEKSGSCFSEEWDQYVSPSMFNRWKELSSFKELFLGLTGGRIEEDAYPYCGTIVTQVCVLFFLRLYKLYDSVDSSKPRQSEKMAAVEYLVGSLFHSAYGVGARARRSFMEQFFWFYSLRGKVKHPGESINLLLEG